MLNLRTRNSSFTSPAAFRTDGWFPSGSAFARGETLTRAGASSTLWRRVAYLSSPRLGWKSCPSWSEFYWLSLLLLLSLLSMSVVLRLPLVLLLAVVVVVLEIVDSRGDVALAVITVCLCRCSWRLLGRWWLWCCAGGGVGESFDCTTMTLQRHHNYHHRDV